MTSHRRPFVTDIIRHDAPRALVAAAIIGALVTAARMVIPPSLTPGRAFVTILVLAILVVGAAALRSPRTSAAAVPWIFAFTVVTIVLWVINEFWSDPRVVAFAYVLLVMVTYGMWLLTWIPFLTSAAVMATASIAAVNARGIPDALDWSVAFLAALVGGALLMGVRLRSLQAVADAQEATARQAMSDPLTGLLNRTGLESRLPELIGAARRSDSDVAVCFVDVDGLKAANDRFGHDFGDEVIVTVAHCVRSSVRSSDLVARWGGDEFVVVGVADDVHFGDLETRIRQSIALSAIDLTRWPGSITLGSTTGRIDELGFEAMLTLADEEMYRERRRRRSGA